MIDFGHFTLPYASRLFTVTVKTTTATKQTNKQTKNKHKKKKKKKEKELQHARHVTTSTRQYPYKKPADEPRCHTMTVKKKKSYSIPDISLQA